MRTTLPSAPEMQLENDTPRDQGTNTARPTDQWRPRNNPSRPPQADATPLRSRKQVVVHWLIVFCVAMAATLILVRNQLAGRNIRAWLLEGHRHFGLMVLVLFCFSVLLRIRSRKHQSTNHSPPIIRVLAALTHFALYALLFIQPMLGWALSDAQGKPVHLLGATLPALVSADFDLADTLQAWHQNVAWLLLALVSLHIVAALWHHFVLHDDVLLKMLPGRRR